MPEPIVCKVTNFGERSQATQTSTIFNTTTQNIQWTTTRRAGESHANSALIGQVLSQQRSIPWAFYGCKKQLLQIQLLVHFEMKKLLKLAMDTSLSEVGGIISHEMDGQESPIAFTSRTLTAIEKN